MNSFSIADSHVDNFTKHKTTHEVTDMQKVTAVKVRITRPSLISTKNSMLELLLEITGRGGQCHPLQNYNIVEVEGTSGGHLVQPSCLSRVTLEKADQDHIQCAFDYLQG